jgi:salicylate hydroxylase
MKTLNVVVAGAGIGGLATALALARSGHTVTVLEQATTFGEVGAGVQLGPNAVKLLAHWGLRGAAMQTACTPGAIAVRSATTGRPVTRMLLGQACAQRHGEVYATLHRADLHRVLLEAVQNESSVTLLADCAVLAMEDDAGKPTLSSTRGEYACDLLAGADGLWSRVREHVQPTAAPSFTGHVAYRSLLPASLLPADAADQFRANDVSVWWAPRLHVVGYPLRGGQLYNLAILAEGPSPGQGWNFDAAPGVIEQVLARCVGAKQPLQPVLAQLIRAAPQWRCWPLFQRRPTPGWSRGGTTLLGDAAHPMLPYLAQGAAMALEDAAVLARCVNEGADTATALARYEQLRFPRTARVVQTAKRNAWAFHVRGPVAAARDAYLALKGTQVLGMDWLYGFEAHHGGRERV